MGAAADAPRREPSASLTPTVMPRTRIKICGITRVDDALAAAQAGADAIGFVLWPGSPRGVTVDAAADDVRRACADVPLDALQFHGAEPPEFCRTFGRPYVKAVPVSPDATEVDLLEYAARYHDACGLLFDSPPSGGLPGGTGQTFDWQALPRKLPRPLVLSGGLNAANVGDAVRRLRPWAVDGSSGVEAVGADGTPIRGRKDPTRIVAFIEAVRNADD